jgi:hypothetical protein
VNFFSLNTIVLNKSCDCNFFPTFVEHNEAFFIYIYYREANTNVASCHGIDAIINRFKIKTRMLMDSPATMDRGDIYT